MRVRCGFYCLTKVRQIALAAACDWPRLLWTEVITCHLRRPPVASALAALHGIRRGLHAAPPAPAYAFGRRCAACCFFDLRLRRVERPLGALRRVGASVPSPRGRRGCVQLLRRSHLSQALKRLIFYPHLWPMIPSTTGTWPIADPPGAAHLRLAQRRSVRSVPSRQPRMRAAPTQRPPIASAEAPHLLPPPMADDPIHNRDLADRRPARRSSLAPRAGSERPFRPLEAGAEACSSYAEATYRKRRNASPAPHLCR